jgi:hypothetical protein
VRIAITLPIFFCAAISLPAQTSVEIDLGEQMAYLLQNGRVALASPISSGRYGHLTEKGSFKVLEKKRTHYSSMYGKIVDSRGNTIVADADADMPIPPGGKFIPAPMHYFMRFVGADGMHADIYQAIKRRTAVSVCRNSTRLRFSIQSVLALRSRCTEGPQPGATWGNHDRHFQRALIDLGTCASIQHLVRLRHLGGGDKRASLIRL